MYFIHADASVKFNYEDQNRALGGMNTENKLLIDKFFNEKEKTKFDIVNCQFAFHYYLKDKIIWENFKYNVKNSLRNGGYFMITHFDSKCVLELLKNKDSYCEYYTDNNGTSNKLFEIVKKFNIDNPNKMLELGNAIDVYAAWMFNEGTYRTEYLVDLEFIKKELEESCDLELVETDLFSNHFIEQKEFFETTYKYQPNDATRKFFSDVGTFFNSTDINKACYTFSFLNRFCIFRKKDKSIIGGNKLNIRQQDKFYIPDMTDYNNDYSFMNSIHQALRTHKIIPKSISVNNFYNDLNLKLINDIELTDTKIKNITKKINIVNNIEGVNKTIIDKLNITILERDEHSNYNTHTIEHEPNKYTKNIVLIKEGTVYNPFYCIIQDKKQCLFTSSDNINEYINS